MLIIHTDGGARGNPGPAGAGVYITDENGKACFSGGYFLGETTNNVAEYNGLIQGLKAAQNFQAAEVEVHCDSELLVRQINGDYKVKSPLLKPLYDQAVRLMANFKKVRVKHVYREMNAQADALANQAMDARRNVRDASNAKSSQATAAKPAGLFESEVDTPAAQSRPARTRVNQGQTKKKLFVIGDSISIGYGPFLEKRISFFSGYARKEGMEQALSNLDYPAGANGGDSSMVLAYLKDCFSKDVLDPDYLMINCGLHDIKTNPQTGVKQVPLDRYRSNLEQIKHMILERGIGLIWVRTTPVIDEVHNSRCREFHRFASDVEAYNAVADAIMTVPDIDVIDLFCFTKSFGDAEIFRDHVHYPSAIEEAQADFIAGFLAAVMR